MFERFTHDARTAVIGAQEHARLLGAREITADHLLLGVLGSGDNGAVRVLHRLGIDRDAVARRTQGLGTADAQALEAIGIDLDAIRERVEAGFGAGALDNPPRRRPGFLSRRGGGHIPFVASAREALVQSLNQAIGLGDKEIRPEHLLLGLLAEATGTATRTLSSLGADPVRIRSAVLREMGKAA